MFLLALSLSILGIEVDVTEATPAPTPPPVSCGGLLHQRCEDLDPTARFEITRIEGTSVAFCDRSTDPERVPIATRAWDFGDGGTATDACPVHAYARGGTYRVVLTVTDAAGQADAVRQLLDLRAPDARVLSSRDAAPPAPRIVRVVVTRTPEPRTIVRTIETPARVLPSRPIGASAAAGGSLAGFAIALAAALLAGRKRSRAMRRTTLAALPVAAVALDRSGHVAWINARAEELLGVAARAVAGRDPGALGLIDQDGAPVGLDGWRDGGTSATAVTRAGSTVALTASPVSGRRRVVGAVVLIHDRAQTVRFDRLAAEFLANVSHELRTPLTPVRGYAEIIGDGRVPRKKAQAYAAAIVEASERLGSVIDVLLTVAQIDAGHAAGPGDRVELRDLIGDGLGRWHARYPGRRISWLAPRGNVAVTGNARLLAMAADQLVDNAVKFSLPETEVWVALRRSGGRAWIEVTDEGEGISRMDMAVIDGDFRQVDGSATRTHGGMGLGLALVRRVATLHGGDLSVSSELGVGSTFAIVLPCAAARTMADVPAGASAGA